MLTYRLYQETDLPSLLRLWEAESGWGAISAEQWRKWYVETPHGPCLVVVAEDGSGEIAGQEVFTPSRLYVDGREVRALRLSAPILRRDLRRQSVRNVDHPVIGLYMTGAEEATAQGYAVVYALPEHNWLPFFRWGPRLGLPRFADAEFECATLSLDRAPASLTPNITDELTARPASEFGVEYEELWDAAKNSMPINCALVRSPRGLRWKISGHLVLEVRRTHDRQLSGYVAVRSDGLLVDILARCSADLTVVLAAAVRWLSEKRGPDTASNVKALNVMQTPALRSALEVLGGVNAGYKFGFVCRPLDSAVRPEEIAPERWYIMPKD